MTYKVQTVFQKLLNEIKIFPPESKGAKKRKKKTKNNTERKKNSTLSLIACLNKILAVKV
jgi:hypothetical protein